MGRRATGIAGLKEAVGRSTLRAVGVLRISKRTEGSTTIERHQKYITDACAAKGWTIVGWARDRGVSATKKGPFERPQLSSWLRRPQDFDILVVYRLDRISRNGQDTRDILTWCTQHQKRLFCTSQEAINFDPNDSSFIARLACEIMMSFATAMAQMEVGSLKERWEDFHESARDLGYWPLATAPYGFMTVKGRLPGATYDGKIVVKNPETFPVLQRIIDDFHDRRLSPTQIASALNAEGVPSPRVAHRIRNPHLAHDREERGDGPYLHSEYWQGPTIRKLLRNRILIGESTLKKEVVRHNETGIAVRFTEPCMTREKFAEIGRRIGGNTRGAHLDRTLDSLTTYVRCVKCGGPAKYEELKFNQDRRQYGYSYYRCMDGSKRDGQPGRCGVRKKGVRAEVVHDALDKVIEAEYAGIPFYDLVTIPGSGSHEDIERTREAYEVLLRGHAKAAENGNINPEMEELFQAQLKLLNDRYVMLREQGVVEPRTEKVPTGLTILDEWRSASWPRRREILEMAGIHVGVDLMTRTVEIWDDGGAKDRLRLFAEGSEIPRNTAELIGKHERGEFS